MKVFDLHCDTLLELNDARKAGITKSFLENDLQIDLQRLKKGDYLLQCFAAFVNMKSSNNPILTVLEEIDIFYEIMNTYAEDIAPVKTFADFERNKKEGKLSGILTIEEGGCCFGNLPALRMFYKLGVRMMTLTWNHENEIAYPNRMLSQENYKYQFQADNENGLKEAGIAFLEEMERLHMIVDVSHLSDAGFWDVVKYGKRPFIASHSNARTLCSNARNLTDDMIKAISERGGLLGINYCASFLDSRQNDNEDRSTVKLMVDHIEYIKNVAGIEVIGLGSDFDGISRKPLEMKDVSELSLLEQELKRRGFSESEIEKIYYKNALRVFKELL